MADWFIATEGVKVVKDSASLGPQIITAVSAIASAVGAVLLTVDCPEASSEQLTCSK